MGDVEGGLSHLSLMVGPTMHDLQLLQDCFQLLCHGLGSLGLLTAVQAAVRAISY